MDADPAEEVIRAPTAGCLISRILRQHSLVNAKEGKGRLPFGDEQTDTLQLVIGHAKERTPRERSLPTTAHESVKEEINTRKPTCSMTRSSAGTSVAGRIRCSACSSADGTGPPTIPGAAAISEASSGSGPAESLPLPLPLPAEGDAANGDEEAAVTGAASSAWRSSEGIRHSSAYSKRMRSESEGWRMPNLQR